MKPHDNFYMGSRTDIVIHRIRVAKEDLATAQLLVEAEQYRGANNRAYYAIYHAIDAVLAIEGKAFKRHKDTLGYFNKNYVATNIFSRDLGRRVVKAEEIRHASDYDTFYPSDEFIRSSLARGEFYILEEQGKTVGCVILNSRYNEGYEGVPWSRKYRKEEVLIPHALAVDSRIQGKGIGRILVHEMINLAREQGMKAIRLDILGGNQVAERLYTGCGFQFVQEKRMFYEDTGWTQYRMYI